MSACSGGKTLIGDVAVERELVRRDRRRPSRRVRAAARSGYWKPIALSSASSNLGRQGRWAFLGSTRLPHRERSVTLASAGNSAVAPRHCIGSALDSVSVTTGRRSSTGVNSTASAETPQWGNAFIAPNLLAASSEDCARPSATLHHFARAGDLRQSVRVVAHIAPANAVHRHGDGHFMLLEACRSPRA